MVTTFTMIFQFIFIQIRRNKIQLRFLMFQNVILGPIMNLSNVSWSQVENWGLIKIIRSIQSYWVSESGYLSVKMWHDHHFKTIKSTDH